MIVAVPLAVIQTIAIVLPVKTPVLLLQPLLMKPSTYLNVLMSKVGQSRRGERIL